MTDERLFSKAEEAALARPRPDHWHFFRIEIEANTHRQSGPVETTIFARAYYHTGSRGYKRSIGVYSRGGSENDALQMLITALSDKRTRDPWSRRG